MTMLNRLLVGTTLDGVKVFAVYDPFFDNIDIEIDGRMWESLGVEVCRKYKAHVETYASDLRYLLIDGKDFDEEDADAMYDECMARIAKYTR